MDLRLLGSVDARHAGAVVEVGPDRQRCVLVALVADANRVISAEELIDRVWGENLPLRCRGTLRTYLSRLRQVLDPDAEIGRRAGGYLLTIDPLAVDLHRFRALVRRASATERDADALALLDEALGLWRGEAFAGLDTPWINTLRDAVAAERRSAELDRIDLRLRLGDHNTLAAELSGQVAERPLDERLAGQYMLALYRAGRQADALLHYGEVRRRLGDALGADPTPQLAALHRQILAADPALRLTHTAAPPAGLAWRPVPRQLPPAPGRLSGRRRELARIDEVLSGGGPGTIAIISGVGGVGKTWLVLHWAHRNAHRFPDGQLFVDLRGFAPDGEPMRTELAVRAFLDALGVGPDRIPLDPPAQVGMYRSLVADRQLLVVLDNARDSRQVVRLLPGGSGCSVLVTSRDRLPGLITGHGARPLTLTGLPDTDARQLLVDRLGVRRVDAEPDAVAELIGYCAGLPLALAIIAGRAIVDPGPRLRTWAAQIGDTATRLTALNAGDELASLTAALSWSSAALDPAEARAFQLLGFAAGADIGLPAAAALLGESDGRATARLRALHRMSLLDEHVAGRWRMHDLVRLHASDAARCHRGEDERFAALHRLTGHHVHAAAAADRLLDPHRPAIALAAADCHDGRHAFADEAAALAYFTAELDGLLAIQRQAAEVGLLPAVWQLAWGLSTFTCRQGRRQDLLTAWQLGLAAARELGDAHAELLACHQLGRAHTELGQHAEAVAHLDHALTLAERAGDPVGQSYVLLTLARTWQVHGDGHRAVEHAERSLRVLDGVAEANPVWLSRVLNAVGWYLAQLGRFEPAAAHCLAALDIYRTHPDRNAEADTLDSLGFIAHGAGRYAEALDWYRQALNLLRETGDTSGEADTLDRTAGSLAALGEPREAERTWQQALSHYQDQGRAEDADRVQRELDQLAVPVAD
ncbi:MAG TPA: BTAD domain-containing putative transcriptional regulator [Actinophytocola sp.]|uniref:AfsR/SARP family transcriptional regulator n=1 Tax=Actinophytocola sp. TaxID=1872138 RepID=UPI002DB71E40|nr:BTAD domain-containing putative transcriptional regulator [Actinophytocola sp.]HEU5475650.1 BTAD domain-containing putative transcriptional regulator [Actinophytocola sp.]